MRNPYSETTIPAFKFVALFVIIYSSLAATVATMPSVSHQFTVFVTKAAGLILALLGFVGEVSSEAIAYGYAEIRFNSTTYRVHEECTGIYLILLVGSAIIAVPSRFHFKFVGLILGSVVAAVIGCLRIVVLGCVAEYHNSIFHLFHTYIMEVVTVGLGLWILTIWFSFTSQRLGNLTS